MTKSQKLWLWMFAIMFLAIETLFSFAVGFLVLLVTNNDLPALANKFFSADFFESNSTIIYVLLGIEYISLIGLFLFNISFNKHKIYKWITALFFGIILGVLSFYIYFIYGVTHFELLM